MHDQVIKSPLNYTGGKHKLVGDLKNIWQAPERMFDLFCGGGTIAVNLPATETIAGESRKELVGLLNWLGANTYDFIDASVRAIRKCYGLSDTDTHSYAYYGCDSVEGLASFNKDGYNALKRSYNSSPSYDKLFCLIVYGFNNQLRFNSLGEYNIPVGKRDYNSRVQVNLRVFVETWKSKRVQLQCADFESFESSIRKQDAIYADPPYLLANATYNTGWDIIQEKRLLAFLDRMDEKGVAFLLSNALELKGKRHTLLEEWAIKGGYTIHMLTMTYANSSYHRKPDSTLEVAITNL